MAKIALVLPPFDLSASMGGGRTRRGHLPPLGVGYLAASLKERGHAALLVDSPALGLNVAAATDAVAAEHPDVIGISCLTRFAPSAYALAEALKTRLPQVPIVMGGAHVTSFWETVLQDCPHIDVLVPGEGERVFAGLVDCLAAGDSYESLPGLVHRDGQGQVVSTPPAELIRNLDSIPNPDRAIYQDSLYIPLPNQCRRKPATTMITARGCPWGRCRFCYQGGKYAPYYRRRSPEHVVGEIASLVNERGIREILFWDDNFCVKADWIFRFCDLLDAAKLDITWTAQARVNLVSREMLQRMAASGCYNIYYGFESGNQELLDMVDKGITLEESLQAVRWAKEAGLEIRGSFILGLPSETPELAEKTIRFACELNVDWMLFFPYHVQRGTALEELALKEGALVEHDIDMHLPSYVPDGYSGPEELAATVQRAYRRYYLRPRYMARALWRARNPIVLRNYLAAFLFWLGLVRKM